MVLCYVRKCIAIVAVTAYIGLAVGGHTLHDVTCDHDHAAISATSPESATRSEHHGHHHGHHHHHDGHVHKTAQTEANKTPLPHGDHDHPPHPRHDHDCLICHFVALNMAIVADAVELPETPRAPAIVSTVVPLQTIFQPFGGNPRAPPV